MNNIQIINEQERRTKKTFDLEDRTLAYSKKTITFAKTLRSDLINTQLISQFIRSATSVGANYREANDALGKKDFFMRIKICRKEAKETRYWLELIQHANPLNNSYITDLIQESTEFIRIFSSIIEKMNNK